MQDQERKNDFLMSLSGYLPCFLGNLKEDAGRSKGLWLVESSKTPKTLKYNMLFFHVVLPQYIRLQLPGMTFNDS